jgi:hypothetical protein
MRGTFEADGGFGKVDIIMRIVDPQGNHLASSPRVANYDFVLPVKVRGEHKFVFDNRYSMFTAKAVGLFYCIDNGRRDTRPHEHRIRRTAIRTAGLQTCPARVLCEVLIG